MHLAAVVALKRGQNPAKSRSSVCDTPEPPTASFNTPEPSTTSFNTPEPSTASFNDTLEPPPPGNALQASEGNLMARLVHTGKTLRLQADDVSWFNDSVTLSPAWKSHLAGIDHIQTDDEASAEFVRALERQGFS